MDATRSDEGGCWLAVCWSLCTGCRLCRVLNVGRCLSNWAIRMPTVANVVINLFGFQVYEPNLILLIFHLISINRLCFTLFTSI